MVAYVIPRRISSPWIDGKQPAEATHFPCIDPDSAAIKTEYITNMTS